LRLMVCCETLSGPIETALLSHKLNPEVYPACFSIDIAFCMLRIAVYKP
jgi:hypothetical protein